MNISVVTSVSSAGYNAYGKENYNKFLSYWEEDINLHIFSEDILVTESDRLFYHNLFNINPKCKEFIERNSNRQYTPPYKQKPYKSNYIKFCFKVYAICSAAKMLKSDIIIWLDSDVQTAKSISKEYISSFINEDNILAYLNREHNIKNSNPKIKLSTETGLIIFNMNHKFTKEFFDRYQQYYDSDNIFSLDETHDAFVFDSLIAEMTKERKGVFKKLSDGITERPLEKVFRNNFSHIMGNKKWK